MDYSQIVITSRSVKTTLNKLVFTAGVFRQCPLEDLCVVDLFLYESGFPAAGFARRYALLTILTDLIHENCARQFRLHNLAFPPMESDIKTVRAATKMVANYGVRPLLDWTLLYSRYGRAELGLSIKELCATGAFTRRTYYRYIGDAIRELTVKLTEGEWEARRRFPPKQ